MNTISLVNFQEVIESLGVNSNGDITLTLTKDSAKELIEWLGFLLNEEE